MLKDLDTSYPLSMFRLILHKTSIQQTKLEEFNSIITYLSFCKRPPNEILAILELLKLRIDQGAQISIQDELISKILNSIAHHDVNLAVEILLDADKLGLNPSTLSYYEVNQKLLSIATAQALEKPKHSRVSDFLRNPMYLKAHDLISKYKFTANDSYKTILPFMKAHLKLQNIEGCRYWLERAKRFQLDNLTILYNILMDVYCRTSNMKTALLLLEEMKSSSDKQKLYPNSFTFGCLLHSVGNNLNVQPLDIIEEMKRLNIKPEVKSWNILIWKAAIVGKIDLVEKYYQKMLTDSIRPDSDTFVARMVALSASMKLRASNESVITIYDGRKKKRSSKEIDSITETFTKAFDIVQEMGDGIIPNAKFLNTFLYLSFEAHKVTDGLEVVEKWLSRIRNKDPVLIAFQKEGSTLSDAHSALNTENSKDYSKVANPKALFDVISMNMVISIKLKLSLEDQAWELFHEMQNLRISADYTTFYLLISDSARKRDEDKLMKLLKLMKENMSNMAHFDGAILFNYLNNLNSVTWISDKLRNEIDLVCYKSGKKHKVFSNNRAE